MTLKWSAIVILGGSFIGHGLIILFERVFSSVYHVGVLYKIKMFALDFGAYPKIYISSVG